MRRSGRNGEVMPTATSRERVVRTGTSSVSTSTLTPAGLGAPDEIEADGVLVARAPIELEPEHIGRDLGGLLDRHAADEPERIGQRSRAAQAPARSWSAPGKTSDGPPIGATPIGAE